MKRFSLLLAIVVLLMINATPVYAGGTGSGHKKPPYAEATANTPSYGRLDSL
jgi:uncharacterized protein (UPF0333 family)